MARRRSSPVHGLLVVDKPSGPTSHDVVAWARRALGTRQVGHAGTLDPMATGVRVLAVGEGTKLVRWLTREDKAYRAELALGVETDTLDAEGQPVERAAVPPFDDADLARVAATWRGPQRQRPPAYSAIKVAGKAAHARARAGEAMELPTRDVTVHELRVERSGPGRLSIAVRASKGFFVRALGRDLARGLGTRGHLVALRRVASGPYRVEEAVDGEVLRAAAGGGNGAARDSVVGALHPLEAITRSLPAVHLTSAGAEDARHGRPLLATRGAAGSPGAERAPAVALLDPAGRLIAVGVGHEGGFRVLRGLRRA
ncbi:MAG: tRNA pseudouridine(55) synthase TruB [Sandaracinaceae bacterium]